MRTKLSVLFSLLVFFGFPCCDNQDAPVIAEGEFTFSFTAHNDNAGGRKRSEGVPAFVTYTLKRPDGSTYSNKIELYAFNGRFITHPQQFTTGHYALEQFLILDSENTVIYVAPAAGSAMAEFVEHPLPLSFDISAGQTTSVVPEVVATEDHLPVDFGYADFSFNVTIKSVKFVLPLHPDLVSKFRSATLLVRQGSYARTVPFSGSGTTLIANVLVRSNAVIAASVVVDVDNFYISAYPPHSGGEDHVELRSSTSQFEFQQQLSADQGKIFSIPQFTHKIGGGWDFRSALLKATGENGAYIQVKYNKEGLCSDQIKIESNVSDFPAPQNGALHMADKVVWSQFDPAYNHSFMIEGVNGFYDAAPTCEGGFCSIYPVWHSESLAEFVPVCEEVDWKLFDSYTRIQTRRNGELNYLNVYFWLEREQKDPTSGAKMKSYDKAHIQPLRR